MFLHISALADRPFGFHNMNGPGEPKTANLGGMVRGRQSGQQIKKALKSYNRLFGGSGPDCIDTRQLFAVSPDEVRAKAKEFSDEMRDAMFELADSMEKCTPAVLDKYKNTFFCKSDDNKDEKKEKKEKDGVVITFTAKELSNLAKEMMLQKEPPSIPIIFELCNTGSKYTALFGRMIATVPMAKIISAIHCSSAITIHKTVMTPDVFTRHDDLNDCPTIASGSNMAGAGHFNSRNGWAGIIAYDVVVDVGLYLRNLCTDGQPFDKRALEKSSTLRQELAYSIFMAVQQMGFGKAQSTGYSALPPFFVIGMVCDNIASPSATGLFGRTPTNGLDGVEAITVLREHYRDKKRNAIGRCEIVDWELRGGPAATEVASAMAELVK